MNILKLVLYPISAVYDLAMRFRNYLYDIGYRPSFEFAPALVSVGNLNVGGSGKTPVIEYLVELLRKRFNIATLSRGYKRDTTGYRIAGATDTARTIGDEPFQLFRKFGPEIKVIVGEDRVFAIPTLLHEFPDTEVILLDDAFQQRSIKPKLTLLLTDHAYPFFRDFVLPVGQLREARSGARRADAIIVTKCSEQLLAEEQRVMIEKIERYAGPKPIFFSSIQYRAPRPLGKENELSESIILVSGIATTRSLKNYCLSRYTILKHFDFGDHHRYSEIDLMEIERFCKSQSQLFSIVTTEKDMVKLIDPDLRHYLDRWPWFYLPIQHVFLKDGLKFDELVFEAVSKAAGN